MRRREDPSIRDRRNRLDACIDAHLAAERHDAVDERLAHRGIVDNALLGDEHRRDAADVRLALTRLIGGQHAEARQAVGHSPAKQLLEPRALLLGCRDDHLAAHFVADAVFLAEALHLPNSVDGESCLERARSVIQPGVQHAAVMSALMLADLRLFLEHDDTASRLRAEQLVRSGESDDAPADDDGREAPGPNFRLPRGRWQIGQ